MRTALLLLLFPALLSVYDGPASEGPATLSELPGVVIPITFSMEPQQQGGYYRPVQPQPYQRKCGTIATDVCAVDVTVPAGATGEQVYQMALGAERQGRKGEAVSYLRKSAELGYAKAQAAVGKNYAHGNGETRNPQQAAYWLGKAAAQGERGAQFTLGEMYENGDGVAHNQAYALRYYQASAAQHDSAAEFALGLDYEFGLGVAHNRATAMQYLRRSSVDGKNADGTDLANLLARAPASRQFHSIDEVSAYAHPSPAPGKAGSCPHLNVSSTGPNMQGAIYLFCQCHPGCSYSSPGFPNMSCSNAGARPYCAGG